MPPRGSGQGGSQLDYCSLPRKELQSLAKKRGIKANLKNLDLIVALQEYDREYAASPGDSLEGSPGKGKARRTKGEDELSDAGSPGRFAVDPVSYEPQLTPDYMRRSPLRSAPKSSARRRLSLGNLMRTVKSPMVAAANAAAAVGSAALSIVPGHSRDISSVLELPPPHSNPPESRSSPREAGGSGGMLSHPLNESVKWDVSPRNLGHAFDDSGAEEETPQVGGRKDAPFPARGRGPEGGKAAAGSTGGRGPRGGRKKKAGSPSVASITSGIRNLMSPAKADPAPRDEEAELSPGRAPIYECYQFRASSAGLEAPAASKEFATRKHNRTASHHARRGEDVSEARESWRRASFNKLAHLKADFDSYKANSPRGKGEPSPRRTPMRAMSERGFSRLSSLTEGREEREEERMARVAEARERLWSHPAPAPTPRRSADDESSSPDIPLPPKTPPPKAHTSSPIFAPPPPASATTLRTPAKEQSDRILSAMFEGIMSDMQGGGPGSPRRRQQKEGGKGSSLSTPTRVPQSAPRPSRPPPTPLSARRGARPWAEPPAPPRAVPRTPMSARKPEAQRRPPVTPMSARASRPASARGGRGGGGGSGGGGGEAVGGGRAESAANLRAKTPSGRERPPWQSLGSGGKGAGGGAGGEELRGRAASRNTATAAHTRGKSAPAARRGSDGSSGSGGGIPSYLRPTTSSRQRHDNGAEKNTKLGGAGRREVSARGGGVRGSTFDLSASLARKLPYEPKRGALGSRAFDQSVASSPVAMGRGAGEGRSPASRRSIKSPRRSVYHQGDALHSSVQRAGREAVLAGKRSGPVGLAREWKR